MIENRRHMAVVLKMQERALIIYNMVVLSKIQEGTLIVYNVVVISEIQDGVVIICNISSKATGPCISKLL